jgi:hypothetical protein
MRLERSSMAKLAVRWLVQMASCCMQCMDMLMHHLGHNGRPKKRAEGSRLRFEKDAAVKSFLVNAHEE